jgi:nucleoside-diphosphate kinase
MIQQTLVLIKPDGVQRALTGEILSRFEKRGLKIIGMKMMWIDDNFAKEHYSDVGQKHGDDAMKSVVKYVTQGPIIALCLEGVAAVEVVRKVVGSTYPSEAMPGTIRGDYAHISKNYANTNKVAVGNLIHASGTVEEAAKEIKMWFAINELYKYKSVHEIWMR